MLLRRAAPLLLVLLAGCSAIQVRAPRQDEKGDPVCSTRTPWPFLDLAALAVLQGTAAAVGGVAFEDEPRVRNASMAVGLGAPAIFLPSMLYGFGRMRQCDRLRYPKLPAGGPEPVREVRKLLDTPAAVPVEPLALTHRCGEEEARRAAYEALLRAGLKPSDKWMRSPSVESEWVPSKIVGRPCSRKLRWMVETSGGQARLEARIFISDHDCGGGARLSAVEEVTLLRLRDALREQLAACARPEPAPPIPTDDRPRELRLPPPILHGAGTQ